MKTEYVLAGLVRRWLAANIDCLIALITAGISVIISLFAGNTPGHAILGMRIVKEDGSRSGFGTMLVRELVSFFLSIPFFGLGYLWAIWDSKRQTWHDKVAGTVVILR